MIGYRVATWCCKPDNDFNLHRCDNLKSHIKRDVKETGFNDEY